MTFVARGCKERDYAMCRFRYRSANAKVAARLDSGPIAATVSTAMTPEKIAEGAMLYSVVGLSLAPNMDRAAFDKAVDEITYRFQRSFGKTQTAMVGGYELSIRQRKASAVFGISPLTPSGIAAFETQASQSQTAHAAKPPAPQDRRAETAPMAAAAISERTQPPDDIITGSIPDTLRPLRPIPPPVPTTADLPPPTMPTIRSREIVVARPPPAQSAEPVDDEEPSVGGSTAR